MKGMLKKLMIYSMLGLMQVGLFATVASAAPRVEEPPAVEECCGDPACMKKCANGVTPECREKHHHKKPITKEVPQKDTQKDTQKDNGENTINRFLQ